MKKLVLVLIAGLSLLSCGDDDSGGSALKPSAISIDGDVTNISYDSKNRIQTIAQAGTTMTFTYNAKGKTDRITSGVGYFQFAYDSNNRLSGISNEGGASYEVTYSGDNTYSVDGSPIVFTPSGDVSNFGGTTLTYTSRKGAFANVKSYDALALLLVANNLAVIATKKRLQTITGAESIIVTYTDGEKGLPATAMVDDVPVIFTYN